MAIEMLSTCAFGEAMEIVGSTQWTQLHHERMKARWSSGEEPCHWTIDKARVKKPIQIACCGVFVWVISERSKYSG